MEELLQNTQESHKLTMAKYDISLFSYKSWRCSPGKEVNLSRDWFVTCRVVRQLMEGNFTRPSMVNSTDGLLSP